MYRCTTLIRWRRTGSCSFNPKCAANNMNLEFSEPTQLKIVHNEGDGQGGEGGVQGLAVAVQKVHWHGGRRGRGLRSSCCSSNSADIFSAPHPLLHHFPQHCCGHRRKFAPMPKQETINWEIQSRLDNSQKLWNIEGLFQNTEYLTSIYCCCPRCYLLPSSSPLNHSPLVPSFPYHWKSFHSSLSLRAQIHILGWNRGKRKLSTWRIFLQRNGWEGCNLGSDHSADKEHMGWAHSVDIGARQKQVEPTHSN